MLDAVKNDVNETIQTFVSCIERGAEDTSCILSLYDDDKKKKKKSEAWEEWTVKLNLHVAENEQQRCKFKNLIIKQLRACLLYISNVNVSETYHIPHLTNPSSKTHFKVSRASVSECVY